MESEGLVILLSNLDLVNMTLKPKKKKKNVCLLPLMYTCIQERTLHGTYLYAEALPAYQKKRRRDVL